MMIKIFIHHEKEKEAATAIQYAEMIRKNTDINAAFVRVQHVPEDVAIHACHEDGIGSARKKQPLGLIPKHIRQRQRFVEVCAAIVRYYDNEKKIPIGWIEEYNELVGVK